MELNAISKPHHMTYEVHVGVGWVDRCGQYTLQRQEEGPLWIDLVTNGMRHCSAINATWWTGAYLLMEAPWS